MVGVIAARPTRRQLFAPVCVLLGAAAVFITVWHSEEALAQARQNAHFWLMAGLATLAALLSFVESKPGARVPIFVCPTICFTFAILLCWDVGPALVAQFASVVVVAFKLRRTALEAAAAAGQYACAFAAAGWVLLQGQPDPFEREGPTNVFLDALTVGGAVVAWLATYGVLVFLVGYLQSDRARPRQVVATVWSMVLYKAALLLLSPVLAVAAHINAAFVPLVFIPLYAVQRMAALSADRDRAAQTDPLTRLANRTRLRGEFDFIVSGYDAARAPHYPRATLLLLDLDRFKDVNDALGHDVGDELLIRVAERLRAVQPPQGTIARLGGDEFAILAPTAGACDARDLAESVVAALAEPISLDGLRVEVTASVGIARHTDAGDGFADLLRHADVAMYEAKRRGDSIAAYADPPGQPGPERLALLADLRDALEHGDRDQISLCYQPQLSLRTGELEGVEALLRWRHPVHGPIAAADVLAVVERTAVMHQLTLRVIDDVVAQVARWADERIFVRASLNISARDLYSEHVVDRLAARLAEHRVPPSRIQVEITESALLADPSRALATVSRIAALGVAISLDDFGTGYSSLQHLRKMPISELKIDRSFVAGMADNHDDAAIVRSTVEMARLLGIRTVAEGVETEYTRRRLAETGCNLVQGYLTARPMPGDELPGWIAEHTATALARRP
jgi:diguanylate cyclase (GGDEF)-like protein